MHKLLEFSDPFETNAVHTIKLRNLLELLGPDSELRQIRTMFPPLEIGSITLVDQIVLLLLIDLVSPKRILEIGTFQGYSTRLFLENSSACEIISIDLPKMSTSIDIEVDKNKILNDGEYNDNYLRSIQNQTGEKYLHGLDKTNQARLNLIKCDSTQLNFEKEVGSIEFAFIDGGHQRDIVAKDTYNVLNQMKSGVIVWHDYSSSIHSDVTLFLSEYSKNNQLFYVSGGLCAFQVVRDSPK